MTTAMKLPVLLNRHQLARRCDCHQTQIDRIFRGGFLPADALDDRQSPLWIESRVERAKKLVEASRGRPTVELSGLDYVHVPTVDELAASRRLSLAWGNKDHDLSDDLRTPEVKAQVQETLWPMILNLAQQRTSSYYRGHPSISFLVWSGLCFMRIRHINSSGCTVRMCDGNRSAHHVTGV